MEDELLKDVAGYIIVDKTIVEFAYNDDPILGE